MATVRFTEPLPRYSPLSAQVCFYRKGKALNHKYWDLRYTGQTVTPLVVEVKLSSEWFCPVCLAELGEFISQRLKSKSDQFERCPYCQYGNPQYHRSITVVPKCMICSGTCNLGHRHGMKVARDMSAVFSELKYPQNVGVEEARAERYSNEEATLRRSKDASWLRLCFMPDRLLPREVEKIHYHVGLVVTVGRHRFSFESQLVNQHEVGCSHSCELSNGATPGAASPERTINFPSLTDDPLGLQFSPAMVFCMVSVQEPTIQEPNADPEYVTFPGLISPALVCTARGLRSDSSSELGSLPGSPATPSSASNSPRPSPRPKAKPAAPSSVTPNGGSTDSGNSSPALGPNGNCHPDLPMSLVTSGNGMATAVDHQNQQQQQDLHQDEIPMALETPVSPKPFFSIPTSPNSAGSHQHHLHHHNHHGHSLGHHQPSPQQHHHHMNSNGNSMPENKKGPSILELVHTLVESGTVLSSNDKKGIISHILSKWSMTPWDLDLFPDQQGLLHAEHVPRDRAYDFDYDQNQLGFDMDESM